MLYAASVCCLGYAVGRVRSVVCTPTITADSLSIVWRMMDGIQVSSVITAMEIIGKSVKVALYHTTPCLTPK